MNVCYENPNNYNYVDRTDVNGKIFWLNWSAWINSIRINTKENLENLPNEIKFYIPKWNNEFKQLIKDNYSLGYPTKLACIYFIYKDLVYRLEPMAFEILTSRKTLTFGDSNQIFEGNHKNIEKDLQDAGCIYTWYNDEFD